MKTETVIQEHEYVTGDFILIAMSSHAMSGIGACGFDIIEVSKSAIKIKADTNYAPMSRKQAYPVWVPKSAINVEDFEVNVPVKRMLSGWLFIEPPPVFPLDFRRDAPQVSKGLGFFGESHYYE